MTTSTLLKPLIVFGLTILPGCSSGGGKAEMNIWKAVEQEDLAFIESYASQGKDLSAGSTLYGTTPLFHALEYNKKRSFSRLLELGADPNIKCRGGKIVVHYAAANGDPFWLQEVLDGGGDPNIMNDETGLKKGRPVVYTFERNLVKNVDLLLQHGMDVNAAVDYRGRDALTIAYRMAQFEIAHCLLEHGADYNRPAIAEEESFISALRIMSPPGSYKTDPHMHKWCQAVSVWLDQHHVDPKTAKWDSATSRWILR